MNLVTATVALAIAVAGLSACDDNSPIHDRVATDPGGVTACGRIEQRQVGDKTQAPGQIECMRRALASHVAAEVTVTRVRATDSGPYDFTFRLGANGQVAADVDLSEGGLSMGDKPYTIACIKPEWLPGTSCPPPDRKSRPAPFTVAPGQRISAETRYVEVLVHPTHCTGGRAGAVLAPTVDRTYGQIRVLYRVSNRPNRVGHCDKRVTIRARLDLRAPLGDRWIVDYSCIMPTVYWREVCRATKIRARAS